MDNKSLQMEERIELYIYEFIKYSLPTFYMKDYSMKIISTLVPNYIEIINKNTEIVINPTKIYQIGKT